MRLCEFRLHCCRISNHLADDREDLYGDELLELFMAV